MTHKNLKKVRCVLVELLQRVKMIHVYSFYDGLHSTTYELCIFIYIYIVFLRLCFS